MSDERLKMRADGVEKSILEAMEQGKFENLPGKGQPLRRRDNPFADPDKKMAHSLLEDNGYSLPWIDERNALQRDIRAAEADLSRTWDWGRRDANLPHADAQWARACEAYRARVQTLNKRIKDYNLMAPDVALHLPLIRAEQVIQSVSGR